MRSRYTAIEKLLLEKLIITILLVVAFVGCRHFTKDVTFEIVTVSSGVILDGNKAYESHDHKWKSSDGKMVSVDLIKFISKDEARSFLGDNKLENMSSSKNYDGRLVNDTTCSITLWKENKLVKIKAPTLGHALAFEKCCSKREFNNF